MGRGISMNKNNISYVSVRYTKKDYQKLRLTLNSDDITLEKAIKIFIDRIEGRFFEQIRTLSNDYNQNGFSIMALACLLIETFAQFIKGLDDTRGVSRQEYIDFLMNSLDCFPTKAAAESFYSCIRCGILHQAQTKKNSALTFDEKYVIEYRGNFLKVSVDNFTEKLCEFFHRYCQQLKEGGSDDNLLRSNFIKKWTIFVIAN